MNISGKLKGWARRIKRDGVTLWFAGKHPATPWYAKAMGLFVVAYALSPIDLIPDFIPVLGYVDDVLLLPCLIWLTIRLLPAEVLVVCRKQADDWLLIVLIWIESVTPCARGATQSIQATWRSSDGRCGIAPSGAGGMPSSIHIAQQSPEVPSSNRLSTQSRTSKRPRVASDIASRCVTKAPINAE